MAASPLHSALEAIRAPLAFAARDEFAHTDRIDDFEASLLAACQRTLELCVPRDLRGELERFSQDLERAIAGELGGDDWRAKLSEAQARAERWCALARKDGWLERSVEHLAGVGPKRATQLESRGLGRVQDLLFHLPARYDDRRSLERVGDLEVGRHATFIAEVQSAEFGQIRMRGHLKRVLTAIVGDDSGSVMLKWFRANDQLERMLQKGVRVLVTGDVKRYRFSKELVHPEVELLGRERAEAGATSAAAAGSPSETGSTGSAGASASQPGQSGGPQATRAGGDRNEQSAASVATDEADELAAFEALRQIVPDYRTPEGIPPRTLRGWIERAVAEYSDFVAGYLPEALVRERELPSAPEALRLVHSPEAHAELSDYGEGRSRAHQRLVLEELYLLEVGLGLRRSREAARPGVAVDVDSSAAKAVASSLPFALTNAQRRAWGEIRRDLERAQPMNRLVQGDVGCGKTAVAFVAAANVAASGLQTAFMAPTELLAEQHLRTLEKLSAGLPAAARPRIALLVASLPGAEQKRVRAGLAAGEIDIAVGTHALVQGSVELPNLALAIVDEQHRFGVRQRAALAQRPDGKHPHTLVMTATPIPRTLAMTIYGDLDVSVIDELPPGRAPVETLLLREGEGKRVVELIRAATGRGEQVYVVYPLVEESEKVDLRAAAEQAERIRRAFPDVAVDLVHGRLDSAERGAAMARFERGESQILVSTTVIEVGVDVAQATLMVIEHAERFGLAQLHQLRGRVGRGDRPGTCVLVARSEGNGGGSEARLGAMLETTDGFLIAEHDLRIRGPGEFLGTRQSGFGPDLRIADLIRDAKLVAIARQAALEQVRRDTELAKQPELRRAVEARWGDRLSLASVG